MASQIRIGTSGYSYPWNEGKPTPFEWYMKQGFNSVEINASFYRFPREHWIRVWEKNTVRRNFTFSIKVHRSITHYSRLKGDSVELWKQFSRIFEPIKDKIDFWLFQMPRSYAHSNENLESMGAFFESIELGNKAIVEFRNKIWWDNLDKFEKIGIAFCSVSAPDLPRNIVAVNDAVYLRLHGLEMWYHYVYSDKELDEMLSKIKKLEAGKKAIYLNNDEGMLPNGRYLLKQV